MQDLVFFFHEHMILFSIWFFSFIAVIFFSTKNIFLKSKIINIFEALQLINRDKAIIIDTRSKEFFKEGHIINSINIPLKNIFLGDIKKVEMYKLSPIILILNDTYSENQCIQELLKYGFKYIYIFKNGIYYWNKEHLPLVVQK